MDNIRISRRTLLATGASALAGGWLSAGCSGAAQPLSGTFLGLGDALTYAAHRTLLPQQALAREFSRDRISPLPENGTTNPEDENYQRLLRGRFEDWRLPISGLVAQPTAMSLDELKRFPARTQITQHTCEEGWSAIAEWTGVQLSRVIEAVGIRPAARYIVFHTVDGWWDSLDMSDALHPQTILTYGMNGRELPVPHGAPIRLRVERQLGYKSLKFLKTMTITDRLDNVEDGTGAVGVADGYSWYSGI
jgi:DMSO/TMAO reductase YedYZ molybdopterin-dependent catalytic subunit